ncbi:MAG: ParB/RepB/Spo0J family partition protein [Sphingobacteriaceae bacterium]
MSSAIKRNALGKGLGALLSDNDIVNPKSTGLPPIVSKNNSIDSIDINLIETNPYQPRDTFETEALNELAASIKAQGIIQPLTVRKLANNAYQLISGERRLRASKLAGLTEVPVYIRAANDQEMLEMALIENIQRENLNAIEVAISFQRMLDECSLKQEELGDRVGKNRSTVTNYLRLLKLPPVIQAALRDSKISMGHARAMISMDSIDKQLYAFEEVLKNDLSVRKLEDLVRSMSDKNAVKSTDKTKSPAAKAEQAFSSEYQRIQSDLAAKFDAKVTLKADKNGSGNIQIPFISTDDLNRILEMLDW